MTSKLRINLKNLRRQRQVEGEHIETKAGWNLDAILYANGVPPFSPGLRGTRYPGTRPHQTIQPQRGCDPNNAHFTPMDGTALRIDILANHSQPLPLGVMHAERQRQLQLFRDERCLIRPFPPSNIEAGEGPRYSAAVLLATLARSAYSSHPNQFIIPDFQISAFSSL